MDDHIAIQQTISRYAEATSRGDWDSVISTFAPDGIWEVPNQDDFAQGHAAVLEAMQRVASPMQYVSQVNAPAVIEIDGDEASARSVIRETAKLVGQDRTIEILGIYHDRLRRMSDGWKFSRRTFVVTGIHFFALASRPEA